MASVTFPATLGADDVTVTDDANETTGLDNYGYTTRLVPAFGQMVKVANNTVTKAAEALASANTAKTWSDSAVNAPGTNATQTSGSVVIGTGSKTITIQPGKAYAVGQTLVAASLANPANFMAGQVTAYSGTSLTLNVTQTGGSGTMTDLVLSMGAIVSSTLPSQTGNSGKFLTTNGTAASWTGALVPGNNLSDVGSVGTARSNLGAQALNGNLTALSGLTLVADRLPYANGSGTMALTNLTAAARGLLDDVDTAAMQSTLSLVPGTHVQAASANLTALGGLTSAADKLPYFTGAGAAALASFTSFGRTLVDDPDAATARGTLGAAGSGANSDITSLTGLTTLLAGRSFVNLQGYRVSTTTATFTADQIVVQSNGGKSGVLNNFNATLDVSMTGSVNGRNSAISSLVSAGWLYVHAIWDGSTAGLWLDSSATAPTLPSGYSYFRRIGAFNFDVTGFLYPIVQRNAWVQYTGPIKVAGGAAAGSTTTPTFASAATSIFAPPTAGSACLGVQLTSASGQAMASPNNGYGPYNSAFYPPPLILAATVGMAMAELNLEGSSFYYAFSASNGYLWCYGYRENY